MAGYNNKFDNQRTWMTNIHLSYYFLIISIIVQSVLCQPGLEPGILERYLNPKSYREFYYSSSNDLEDCDADDKRCGSRGSNNGTPDSSSAPSFNSNEFFGIFSELNTSWFALLQTFRSIFGSAGGTNSRRDVFADTMEEALQLLIDMKTSSSKHKWSTLESVIPFHEFDRNGLDDLFLAYLHWSVSDGAPNPPEKCSLQGGVNGQSERINVSKAYRRLEAYASWMQRVLDDIQDPPLTAESISNIWKLFPMKLTYDECHRIVWWLDVGQIDLPLLKTEVESSEITRLFVWLSHYLLFQTEAQTNGIVFVSSLNQIGFWPFMTMLPVDTGMQLNEFVISVIPVKTNFVLLLERPAWAKFAFQLLKPFLGGNMQRRVIVIEEGLYSPDFVYEVLGHGPKSIPLGVKGYNGSPEADFINAYFEERVKMPYGKGGKKKPAATSAKEESTSSSWRKRFQLYTS
mmetsp:Transcript_11315/g.16623  ORF Transcript_11315/g.16623 Transcript_11315/m.16623 type:complete len:459 (+) Transcript_11315:140-1516(+)|eukprot:CAMPEP_0194205950 /NCGR_PEP_ID=MMETSP0156-20130528/5101_1 /TAXON_ID=33649 /ORGANISM="Thalassionema nitzschioides, Strain L26-B" /LENGTH=458 /DNA_ID=CAMNT_0038932349 /DNA_START=65 /DNA_END=1441 /DNA_ORIENTATION=-